MIRAARELMTHMMRMRLPWNVWVVVLLVVNLGGGLLFIQTFEGRFATGAMILSFLIMVVMYSRKGFVRLLGLAHIIVWVPLIAWIRLLLVSGTPPGLFGHWLHAIIWLNGISLFLDGVDVIRYVMGNQEPISSTAPRERPSL